MPTVEHLDDLEREFVPNGVGKRCGASCEEEG